MFIESGYKDAALRQEGHVCDPTECMSLESHMTLLTEGSTLRSRSL